MPGAARSLVQTERPSSASASGSPNSSRSKAAASSSPVTAADESAEPARLAPPLIFLPRIFVLVRWIIDMAPAALRSALPRSFPLPSLAPEPLCRSPPELCRSTSTPPPGVRGVLAPPPTGREGPPIMPPPSSFNESSLKASDSSLKPSRFGGSTSQYETRRPRSCAAPVSERSCRPSTRRIRSSVAASPRASASSSAAILSSNLARRSSPAATGSPLAAQTHSGVAPSPSTESALAPFCSSSSTT